MKSVKITHEKRNENALIEEMTFAQDNGVSYEFKPCVAIVPGSLDIDIWHAENCMLLKRTSHYSSGGETVETFILDAKNQPRLFNGDDIFQNITQEHFTKIVDSKKDPVAILETTATEFYKNRCIEITLSGKSVLLDVENRKGLDIFSMLGLPVQKSARVMLLNFIGDIPETEDYDLVFGEVTYLNRTEPLYMRNERLVKVLSCWSTGDIKRTKEEWEKETE